MTHNKVHVELCIIPDSEPISGCVVLDGGEREEFAGWVELTAAIESARQQFSCAAPPRSAGTG